MLMYLIHIVLVYCGSDHKISTLERKNKINGSAPVSCMVGSELGAGPIFVCLISGDPILNTMGA